MYKLASIIPILGEKLKNIISFVNSQMFNYCLHCYDPSYIIPQYVYFIIFDGFVKIGRTYNLKRRYTPSELKDNVKRIVFIENVKECEKELKDKFKNKYKYYIENSLERFVIKDIKRALQLFDSIVKKYKIKNIENPHIKYYHMDKQYGTDYYISYSVVSLLISTYKDINYDECLYNINNIELFYNKINKNDFVSSFKEEEHLFNYWKYYGYMIIIDSNTNQLNISRLWKSILKTDSLKDKLYRFLNLTDIKRLIKEENIKIETRKYKNKPLLNGKYGPIFFIHLILHYLNAKYMLKVSQLLTEMIFKKKIEIRSISGGSKEYQNIILSKIIESELSLNRFQTILEKL